MTGAESALPIASLLLLGAGHGINPGMGWLFAVGLAMQERSGRAVWRALPPLAIGHACAIVVAVLIGVALGFVVPLSWLKYTVAAVLIGFGIFRAFRSGHPRYGGMRVTARQLTMWSFLMASAHGAGLMVLPVIIGGGHTHAHHVAQMQGAAGGILAAAIHTIGYLLMAALLAMLVYWRLGLRRLRAVWLNLDRIWAIALVLTGLVTPLL
jgi:hypothetical protein